MKYVLVLLILITSPVLADWMNPVPVDLPVGSEYEQYDPTIAADKSYLIFSSDNMGGYGFADIFISAFDFEGDVWKPPYNLGSGVNSEGYDSTPHFAYGDTILYFASTDTPIGYGGWDIYHCDINDGIAGSKSNEGHLINTEYDENFPVLLPDGSKMYFHSDRPGGEGQGDIWVVEKVGGGWGTPVNIGPPINTDAEEWPHWISDDDTILVFSSIGDLWYSVKNGDGWGEPVNFGGPINSPYSEIGCTFYCNHGDLGGVMYFGSDRPGAGGFWNIWKSTDSNYVNITPASLGDIKATFR